MCQTHSRIPPWSQAPSLLIAGHIFIKAYCCAHSQMGPTGTVLCSALDKQVGLSVLSGETTLAEPHRWEQSQPLTRRGCVQIPGHCCLRKVIRAQTEGCHDRTICCQVNLQGPRTLQKFLPDSTRNLCEREYLSLTLLKTKLCYSWARAGSAPGSVGRRG